MGKDISSFSDESVSPNPDRERVLIVLYGSEAGITNLIHTLHQQRFATPREWSKLMPAPNYPGKLMSVLNRWV